MQRGNYLLISLVLCGVLVASSCVAGAATPKKMPRVTVWFNGREADLEKPVVRIGNQLYISFTDLVRHLRGTLAWGPEDSYVEGRREDTVVRVIPGRSYAYVNAVKTPLKSPARRIGNRTYVPLETYCRLFGVAFKWDATRSRVDVTWSKEEE